MRTVSRILLTAAAVAVLAAIWAPGTWWQWGLTAIVLLLAAAGTGAAAERPHHPIDGPELMPEHVAREFVPPNIPITADEVDEYKRREYGRKAADQ